MLRQTLITFAIAVVLGCLAYWLISRTTEVQKQTNAQGDKNVAPSNGDAAPASGGASRPKSQRLAIQPEYVPEDWQAPDDTPGAEVALRQSRTTQAVLFAVQTRQVIQELRAAIDAWQKTYAPIVTTDAGRRIAASEPHLNLALTALHQEHTADDVIASWLIEIDQLAGPLERGEQLASSMHTHRIAEIRKIASTELGQLEAGRFVLDTLLKDTAENAPAAHTIEEVRQQRRVAREKIRFAELAKAEEAAFNKGTADLIQAIKERAVKETEIEVRKIVSGEQATSAK
jgi:hypothetical protein